MSTCATPEVFTEITVEPFVRGRLHRPEKPNGDGLVITHGAGGNCGMPILIALGEAFCAAGVAVPRCDMPFRQDRPYGPPHPGNAKNDRAGLKNAVDAMKSLAPGRIFLGGHSYGGRQSSMLAAEEQNLVAGLLLTSYPLHAPGKPEQLRVQHLPDLKTPSLFVQGTRDAFGTIAEVEQALKMIPAKTKLLVVENAGHDLGFKGKARRDELILQIVAEFEKLFGKA